MEIGSREAPKHEKLTSLMPHLRDADSQLRQLVIYLIGQLGDRSAVGELWECLQDESPTVRGQALRALANLGERSVLGACVDRFKQSEENERLLAMAALDALGGDEATARLRECWLDVSLAQQERVMLAMLLAKRKIHDVEAFLEQELKGCEEDTLSLSLAASLAHFGNKAGLSLIRLKLAAPLSESAKSILGSMISDLRIFVDPVRNCQQQLSSWVEQRLQLDD